MRIDRIAIRRLEHLQELQLELRQPDPYYFSPMNLTILVGENGTGKTTLLKFLSQIFLPAERERMDVEYKVHYELPAAGSREITEWSIPDRLPRKVIVSTFSPHEQFNRRSNPRYAYVGASGAEPIKSLFFPLIEIVSSEDFKKRDALQALLYQIGYPRMPWIELDASLFNEAYMEEREEEARLLLVSLLEHYERYGVEFPNRRLLPIDAIHEFPGGRLQWIKALKKFRVYANTRIANLWFPRGDELIPITAFSSGEVTLYYRIFRILHVMTDDALVLLDEPETHLHPKWIQKYTMLLRDVFREYSSHFIIATHSPIITSDVPRECVLALKNEDGRIVPYNIQDRTLGTSPREIFHEVFGLSDYIGDLTEATVRYIQSLLSTKPAKNSREYYRALSLYRDLGDSDRKFELFNQLSELYPEEFGYVEN